MASESASVAKTRRTMLPRRARSGLVSRLQSRCAVVVMLAFLFMTGCGSVGKNIGLGLAGAGVVASTTTGIIAFGCSTPDLNDPQIEHRGPCLPSQTYEEAKPVIWTTFVLGIIMAAAGVAVFATVDEKPRKPDPRPHAPPPDPLQEQSCKDSKYCY
jgi:hypothetical protein